MGKHGRRRCGRVGEEEGAVLYWVLAKTRMLSGAAHPGPTSASTGLHRLAPAAGSRPRGMIF